MDIEKQVLELRTRINSLRAQLELNSTHDNSNDNSNTSSTSSSEQSPNSHSEKPKREPTSSELLKAKLMGKRSSNSSNDSDSSTSSWNRAIRPIGPAVGVCTSEEYTSIEE